jgi:hypothetical protein
MYKLFLIIILLIISNVVYSFDFSSYLPVNNENLEKFIDQNNLNDDEEIKISTVIELINYPIKISEKNLENAEKYGTKYFNKQNLFGYEMTYKIGNYTVLFLFQSPLMKYLPKEVKLNNNVELFLILLKQDGNIILLVNEFNSDKNNIPKNYYPYKTIDDLDKFVENELKEIRTNSRGPGLGMFNFLFSIPFKKLELTEKDLNNKNYNYKSKIATYRFKFSDKIIDYLKNNNFKTDELMYYCIFRTFNDFGFIGSIDVLYIDEKY